jgi:hypothetical protein
MTSGYPPPAALSDSSPFLFNFFCFSLKKIGKLGEKAKPFGRMGIQHLHFLKLAPTLGSVKSSIPQGVWRNFFWNFFC